MSSFANSILDRINYHKSMNSSENALNNLSKINKSMDTSNIFALAYLANNPALTEEERNIFNECVKSKAMQEYEMYSKCPLLQKAGPCKTTLTDSKPELHRSPTINNFES